jgi:hypothetical protein
MGLLTLLWMGYLNFRQTGSALVTAYQVYTNTYQIEPIFRWGRFREPPVYHDPIMREVYTLGASTSSQYARQIQTFVPKLRDRAFTLWSFYCGVGSSALLLIAMFSLRSYAWCALASVAAVIAGLLLGSRWVIPHYAAPMTGPLLILLTLGWYRLRAYRFHRQRTGLFLARITLAICVTLVVCRTVAFCTGFQEKTHSVYSAAWLTPSLTAWTPVPDWPLQRAEIERQLEHSGRAHLILVRYSPNHHPEDEWIYNKANIDGAPVVWAREMDPAQNRKLIDYFHSRNVWLLEADQPAPKLVPYPPLAPGVASSKYDSGGTPESIQNK